MKYMQARPFIIAGILILTGVCSGTLLGHFTTGDTSGGKGAEQSSVSAPSWAGADPESAAAVEPAVLAAGPNHYDCKGCGPTLAEQRERAEARQYGEDSGYAPGEFAPLPPYRPQPDEEEPRLSPADREPLLR